MRKLFSLLAMSLLALSAHATVVTQDISLSGFDPYGNEDNKQGTFNSSTLVYSDIPASGAGQIWIGDDNSYALDANGWSYIGLDLATAAANNVALTVEYTTADATPSQTMEMKAGKLSQLMKLNGRYIKKIEIRNNSSVSNAVISLAKLYLFKADGVSEETILWNESRAWGDWDYENRIVLAYSVFNAVHEGDELVVTYTTGANGQCALRIQDLSDGANYLNEAGDYADVAVNQSSPANFTVVLRESDITALKAHGLYINGRDITVSRVKLVTYAQQFMEEYVLNVGSESIDWSAHWEHTSDLPALSEGDELRVTVSAVDNSGNYQVNFRHDNEGNNPVIVDGITSTVPTVYRVVLTAAQATDINNGKLFIVGTGVTLSRFAIAKPRSIYTALYHGEQAMDWTGLFFEASNFSGLTVGDRLCANVSAIGGNYPQLYFDADDTEFSPATHYAFSAKNAAPMTISYTVTAEMLSLIQSKGLRVKGQNCTITEVYVQDAEPTTVSYKLPVTSAGMATLVLPFNVPSLPTDVQAYNLTNNGDATIWAEEVTSLQADKPVLIVADENAEGYEFVSEEGASDDIYGKAGTYRNGALVGTYQRIDPLYGDDGGDNYHYILQKHDEEVAFYQVQDASCSVDPYRAYLSCGYNASTAGPNSAPMRIVFHKDGTTGVENTESAKMDGSTKFIRDGQLIILRNGVEYNANGALVK